MGATYRAERLTRRRGGFTLIEILVTVTISSLALAVLVAGLRSGARAYQSVLRHQALRAEEDAALSRMREDLRHVCRLSEDVPPLVGKAADGGGKVLRLTAVTPVAHLRAGLGGIWSEIEYRVGADARGEPALVREAIPYVAAGGILGDPGEPAVLLPGVTQVDFEFLTDGTFQESWSDPERPPSAVSVTLTRTEGAPLSLTVWLPGGMGGGGP